MSKQKICLRLSSISLIIAFAGIFFMLAGKGSVSPLAAIVPAVCCCIFSALSIVFRDKKGDKK